MDPRDLLAFLARRFWELLTVVVVVFGLTFVVSANTASSQREALVFLTLGMDLDSAVLNPNDFPDNVDEIADSFTETVQGWFFNPAFTNVLNDRLDAPIGLSARKQEAQNLIVTLALPESLDPQETATIFLTLLDEEIERYNEATHSSFLVALSSVTPSETPVSHGKVAGVAAVLALVLVFFGFLLIEYLMGRLTFPVQAQMIMGSTPLKRLSTRNPKSLLGALTLARALVPSAKTVVVVGSAPTWDVPHLKVFPRELSKLSSKEGVLLWVRLGKTSEEELREARAYWGSETPWIVSF